MIVYFDTTKLIKVTHLIYRQTYETNVVVCTTKRLYQFAADNVVGYLGIVF